MIRRAGLAGLYIGLLGCNAAAWLASLFAFHRHPGLLGMAGLAYTLGLRHAVDADHIAAIDNATRKLMQAGQRPNATGLYFSLGHSTVVLIASMVLVWTAGNVSARFDWLKADGTLVGTAVSVAFLLGIALFNLSSLCSTYRLLRRLRAGRAIGPELLQEPAVASGLLARVLSPVLRLVARSSHMYPVGFLFGLGFDTATEVAVLGMAATGAASGLDPRAILLFPALFACGMALVDTLDSTLMVAAYGCALARPAAKLRYNMAMTGISIVIAVAVGTVEAAGLLGERLRLAGRLWQWVRVLNDNFAFLGYLIAGIFAVGWVIAALVRELSSARPRSLRRRDSSPMPGKYSHLLPDESFPGGPDRADRVTRLQGIET